jgi:hypothetical protein
MQSAMLNRPNSMSPAGIEQKPDGAPNFRDPVDIGSGLAADRAGLAAAAQIHRQLAP